jgi:hypothetical protein
MMHGTKKSHSSIVPAKPANKAEQDLPQFGGQVSTIDQVI